MRRLTTAAGTAAMLAALMVPTGPAAAEQEGGSVHRMADTTRHVGGPPAGPPPRGCSPRPGSGMRPDCLTHSHRGAARAGTVRAGGRYRLSVRLHPGVRRAWAARTSAATSAAGPRLQVQHRRAYGADWRTAATRRWPMTASGRPAASLTARVRAPRRTGGFQVRTRLTLPAVNGRQRDMSAAMTRESGALRRSGPTYAASAPSDLLSLGAAVYLPIRLQVGNAQPGQRIALRLQGTVAPVEFATGPAFSEGTGVQVGTESGPLPLSDLSLGPGLLSVQTSDSGYGDALDFTVSAFLVARAGVQEFSLASQSDPGVEVTAQVGTSEPVVVNQSTTLFLWNP